MLSTLASVRSPLILLISAWLTVTYAVALPPGLSQVRLVLDSSTVAPGHKLTAAIEMTIPEGWHTYWRNPGAFGSVGMPAKVKWSLPPGISAGVILWPTPEKVPDPLGGAPAYEKQVTFLVPLTVAPDAAAGTLELKANFKWQECKSECVQCETNIVAALVIGREDVPSPEAAIFEMARSQLPGDGAGLKARAYWEGPAVENKRPLVIEWETPSTEGEFFPFENSDASLDGNSELLTRGPGTLKLRRQVDKPDSGWPKSAHGLLVSSPTQHDRKGYEVDLPIAEAGSLAASPAAPAVVDSFSLTALLPMLGLAFLGGMILNIMPCVLPVLALKILGFVRQAGSNPGHVRRLGLIYGAGVLTSFLVLASVALAVQAAGSVAGWSTAFQNPQFRVIMCALLVLVALNLFGVFEINFDGDALDQTVRFARNTITGTVTLVRKVRGGEVVVKHAEIEGASDLIRQEGPAGAFFNGVLAAVLATPCTAPMLGTAIGFAFTQPPLVLILIFLTVGLGLATPFVLLCWKPGWLKWLPKPGNWMVRFKVAMGFPILATCVWIFWFTAGRMGSSGVLWLGLFLVVLSAAAWVWGEFGQKGGSVRNALIVVLLLVGGGYFGILESQLHWRAPNRTATSKVEWQTWSPAAVETARKSGHPVLVDFTADNCLNCQINKKTSIEISSTIELIKKFGVKMFEGDYTDADPAIAEELKRYGRRGVPLVLVYSKDPSKAPRELPSILTPAIVHEALEWASQ